jgi:hypothetical protein
VLIAVLTILTLKGVIGNSKHSDALHQKLLDTFDAMGDDDDRRSDIQGDLKDHHHGDTQGNRNSGYRRSKHQKEESEEEISSDSDSASEEEKFDRGDSMREEGQPSGR